MWFKTKCRNLQRRHEDWAEATANLTRNCLKYSVVSYVWAVTQKFSKIFQYCQLNWQYLEIFIEAFKSMFLIFQTNQSLSINVVFHILQIFNLEADKISNWLFQMLQVNKWFTFVCATGFSHMTLDNNPQPQSQIATYVTTLHLLFSACLEEWLP